MKAYTDSPVRFREDVGFEFRCPTCRTFWPLSREFWYPRRGMRRCLACIRAADARGQRRRYLRNTTHRERRIIASRTYRAKCRRRLQVAA
jgi:hypothetical protein